MLLQSLAGPFCASLGKLSLNALVLGAPAELLPGLILELELPSFCGCLDCNVIAKTKATTEVASSRVLVGAVLVSEWCVFRFQRVETSSCTHLEVQGQFLVDFRHPSCRSTQSYPYLRLHLEVSLALFQGGSIDMEVSKSWCFDIDLEAVGSYHKDTRQEDPQRIETAVMLTSH